MRNHKTLTFKRFISLPRHEQTLAFFSHDSNRVRGKNGSYGPDKVAQAEFVNDWLSAFHTFSLRLPNY